MKDLSIVYIALFQCMLKKLNNQLTILGSFQFDWFCSEISLKFVRHLVCWKVESYVNFFKRLLKLF